METLCEICERSGRSVRDGVVQYYSAVRHVSPLIPPPPAQRADINIYICAEIYISVRNRYDFLTVLFLRTLANAPGGG